MNLSKEYFRIVFYTGRIVRHKGERKVIKYAGLDNENNILITFLDNTRCTDLKDIELDGRR